MTDCPVRFGPSIKDGNLPDKEDQHDFKEAQFDVVGQPSLVLRVDSLSSF